MKEKVKKYLKMIMASSGIAAVVLVCMYHSSCHITPEGIVLLTEDYTCPKIDEYKVDGSCIDVFFTKNVSPEQCFAVESSPDKKLSSIENFLNAEIKFEVTPSFDEEKKCIHYKMKNNTEIGKNYELYAVVRDEKGSSLSFALPFLGENDHVPDIVISEINDGYSKKDGLFEYIELYAVTSGNLFGLELVSASDGKAFELPAAEVKKGEYILVHLRKDPENKQAVTETGADLNLSKARGSVYGARDIWIESSESALNSTAEIVLLKNKANNNLLDCILYCKKEYAETNDDWKTDSLKLASKQCIDSGLWQGDGKPSDSVYSKERKSISYISRKNISGITPDSQRHNDSLSWTGTAKSKMTPGKKNTW